MFRKTLLACVATLAPAVLASAQTDPLAAWQGEWRGTCEIAPPYRGVERFAASLRVRPLGLAGRFTWRLIYDAAGTIPRSERNYELRAADAAKGHYELDEKNGLILDAYLSGAAIHMHFSIGGGFVPALYLLLSDREMLVDMPGFETKAVRRTCATGAADTCVETYRLTGTQRCRLQKSAR